MGILALARVQAFPGHPRGGVFEGDAGGDPPRKQDHGVVFNLDEKHQAFVAGVGLGGPLCQPHRPCSVLYPQGVTGSPESRGMGRVRAGSWDVVVKSPSAHTGQRRGAEHHPREQSIIPKSRAPSQGQGPHWPQPHQQQPPAVTKAPGEGTNLHHAGGGGWGGNKKGKNPNF